MIRQEPVESPVAAIADERRERPGASRQSPSMTPETSPGREASWEGRTGCVGYVAKMFPRISETFVLREILALRRQGIPLRIYSLLPPTRDSRIHPEVLPLMTEVEILPQPGVRRLRPFATALWRCARDNPWSTALETVCVLLLPSPRCLRRFFRAVILAARMREEEIAHLHAAWAHTPASVARIASRLARVPWSMGAHAKDIHLSRPRSLAKKIAAARFTTTCTRTNQRVLEKMARDREEDLPAPAILLHYHGVDTAYFSPETLAQAAEPTAGDPPLVVSVGRLVPKKGFDLLVDAAAILRDGGVAFSLEIIGHGPLERSLRQQVRSRSLEDRVTLRGLLVQDEVRAAYRRASCVVLACRVAPNGDRDGIPNTLAEAMATGVPVVATRLQSIEEIVRDRETGILVPSDDARALAQAIESLLADPARGRQLGRRAREWIEREFDGETWGAGVARRFERVQGVERALYITADRGVPVRGAKGASVHVRAVSRAMDGLGVGVRILTTHPGPSDGPQVQVPVIATGTGRKGQRVAARLARFMGGGIPLERALLRLADNLPVYRKALRQARAWHADMIYERYALTAFAGSLVAQRLGIPHILEVNAPLAEEEARFRGLRLGPLTRALEGWIMRRADRVVVVSRALEAHARRLGVRADRIVVLPNAVDERLFHPGRDGGPVRERYHLDGSFVVGFAGTLKPWHGLDHLLRAVALFAGALPQARLLVVGDGPERVKLIGLARELDLAGRVHFTGHVTHEMVGDYLAACDVLVAPYGPLENHWFSPLKVYEYLAVGRPVIASSVGQLEEFEGAGAGVMLVPPGDEAALARALSRLASDPELTERLTREATGRKRQTWNDVVERVLTETEAARRQLWGWRT